MAIQTIETLKQANKLLQIDIEQHKKRIHFLTQEIFKLEQQSVANSDKHQQNNQNSNKMCEKFTQSVLSQTDKV